MAEKTNIDIEYENYSKVMFAWGLLSSLDFSNDGNLKLEQLMIGEAELANTIKKVDTLCDKFNKRLWLICRKERFGEKVDGVEEGIIDYWKMQICTFFDTSRSKYYLDAFMERLKGYEIGDSKFPFFPDFVLPETKEDIIT